MSMPANPHTGLMTLCFSFCTTLRSDRFSNTHQIHYLGKHLFRKIPNLIAVSARSEGENFELVFTSHGHPLSVVMAQAISQVLAESA